MDGWMDGQMGRRMNEVALTFLMELTRCAGRVSLLFSRSSSVNCPPPVLSSASHWFGRLFHIIWRGSSLFSFLFSFSNFDSCLLLLLFFFVQIFSTENPKHQLKIRNWEWSLNERKTNTLIYENKQKRMDAWLISFKIGSLNSWMRQLFQITKWWLALPTNWLLILIESH